MAAPWDNIPLNTPTHFPELDSSDFEFWVTRSVGGFGFDYRVIPGSVSANRQNIEASIANALVRLRQIQTQANTFSTQANYGTSNVANLNDLLTKSKLMAVAISDVAGNLIALARLLSKQFEATN